eukprot:6185925-Pleurochrysis_carterae.AAC.2
MSRALMTQVRRHSACTGWPREAVTTRKQRTASRQPVTAVQKQSSGICALSEQLTDQRIPDEIDARIAERAVYPRSQSLRSTLSTIFHPPLRERELLLPQALAYPGAGEAHPHGRRGILELDGAQDAAPP